MDYNDFSNNEPSYKTLEEALELVKKAVQGEREDELFYNYLISVAPTKEEEKIISDIRDDEKKHNEMFREIYAFYTGVEIPRPTNISFKEPESYIAGIKKAFFGELEAMERYRIIRAGLPSRYHRDMVFEILTDELKHADKYNYILNLNLENMNQQGNMKAQNTRENQEITREENITMDELLHYIEPLVKEAVKEAEAGQDLRSLFQKYIIVGILIGNGFTMEQGVEQVKAWERYI